MSAPTPHEEVASSPSRKVAITAVVIVAVAALVAVVWWLSSQGAESPQATPSPSATPTASVSASPSPSVTPSATESAAPDPTPEPPAEATFYDVNGYWCQDPDFADVWAAEPCFTIDLPHITLDSSLAGPEYVFPATGADSDPSTWAYDDLELQDGGCWRTATDSWPATSGAAFIFCPAGAQSVDGEEILGDPAVDHVFVTHEWPTPGYIRADS